MINNVPLVSIITVTLNSSLTIKNTMDSVLNQSYNNIEYIVVDGKSTDGTIDIINNYRSKIEKKGIKFKFLSEKDNGIAHAWNKGLKSAKGLVIGILNSDDCYERKTIDNVLKCIDPDKKQISYGICKRVDNHKNVVDIMNGTFNPNRIYLNFGFSHTTCFMTEKVINEVGYFDENYKIAMDVDFLLRCINRKIPFIECRNTTYMRLGGVSTKNKKQALMEYQNALRKNEYNIILVWLFGLLKKSILYFEKT